jgi:hypothetical protein
VRRSPITSLPHQLLNRTHCTRIDRLIQRVLRRFTLRGKKDRDGFEQILYQILDGAIGLPYLIVQFIRVRDFESLKRAPTEMPEMWKETGRQLAKLHSSSVALKAPPWAARYSLGDPFPHIDQRVSEGRFSAEQANFLKAWARKLERTIQTISLDKEHFVHADVQMSSRGDGLRKLCSTHWLGLRPYVSRCHCGFRFYASLGRYPGT